MILFIGIDISKNRYSILCEDLITIYKEFGTDFNDRAGVHGGDARRGYARSCG